jgi:SAM-dependent methyltransferase
MTMATPETADYGIDAPWVVLGLGLAGAAFIAGGIAAELLLDERPALALSLCITGVMSSLPLLVTSAVMAWSSRVGKLRMRDRVLDAFRWQGHERILDVGCGRGLLLIGAAKRLARGKAVGVDIWQTADQSGNSPDAALRNARAEGVQGIVELASGNATLLPFRSESFDAVVSSFVLHNIHDRSGREKAVREIVRVLKPGGRVSLTDITHTQEYARVLEAAGMTSVEKLPVSLLFMLPTRTVTARKASA